ncbi:lipase family protein [Skermania sp. ID1734]|uniref:lipase family protein n=1 Tax=Skermania sp. ID1734 TaxID=2597516 RepID=UPI00163DC5B5|nr:lipase family protein [Skermania sp. ID1734]
MTATLVLAALAPETVVSADTASYEASFYPGPSGDSYLDQHLPVDASMPNGKILSSRSVAVLPPLAITNSFDSWQIWFKSTNAGGQPIAALTTLLKPKKWNGKVVSNNYAIDGDGLQCNPSYALIHNGQIEAPDITRQLLGRGYAVVMTDYQGPLMAYAHGPTEGPEVLDGIRAALAFPAAGLAGSPVAMVGYSGGAIATVWAAQLQPTYAPELNMVGAAAGGTPADLSLLPPRMDGKPPAAVLYLLAVLGVAKASPGALELLNSVGVQTGQKFKNSCFNAAVLGVTPLPLRLLCTTNPYQTTVVQNIFALTKAGQQIPRMPIFLWHGSNDLWIPLAGEQALYNTWKNAGVSIKLHVIPGEHVTAAYDPAALDQIDSWMGR